MTPIIWDWVSSGLMVAGALLAVLAAVGLHRFDNVVARMHAATKPATLGLVLVVGGAAFQLGDPGDSAKLALVLIFQFVTAPIGAHLIGRAAYRSVDEVKKALSVDELGDDLIPSDEESAG